jgi:hypothetical protein
MIFLASCLSLAFRSNSLHTANAIETGQGLDTPGHNFLTNEGYKLSFKKSLRTFTNDS